MNKKVFQLLRVDPVTSTPRERLDCIASFAAYCASCRNDYIDGLYFVNQAHMFAAFRSVRIIAGFSESLRKFVIIPDAYKTYIKGCYWHSLMSARGNKNKPTKSIELISYEEMARVVAEKYKGATSTRKHMPDETQLKLMYARLTWWLVYVSEAYNSSGRILDHNEWGWPENANDVKK